MCHSLCLEFVRRCSLDDGGLNVPQTHSRMVKSVRGDGNYLFCSFSNLVTGSEEQYALVSEVILSHVVRTEHLMIGHHVVKSFSIVEYIRRTNMDWHRTWVTHLVTNYFPHVEHYSLYLRHTSRYVEYISMPRC